MPDVADLAVIVPSRGRPAAARELAETFAETCTANTHLILAVDADDPHLDEYRALVPESGFPTAVAAGAHRSMVEALNLAAQGYPVAIDGENPVEPFAYGFLGDDHRPRVTGWDKQYLDALRELGTGMVYGDDRFKGRDLPTQIAMTSDIVEALGWMAPPSLIHMYVDDWWLQLGLRAGCIRYLPDVVVEHMHPVARHPDGTPKAEWTDGHRRVNAPAMYQRDAAAFARLQATELPGAVEKVKALRGAR